MKKSLTSNNAIAHSLDESDPEFQNSLTRAIYESSPSGILVVNAKGLLVSHNQKFVDVWKIQNDGLHGPGLDLDIGAKDEPILAAVLERVKDRAGFLARVKELYDNPQLDDHCEIELKDGRTLERHSTVLRNDHAQYLGRVWLFRDITPQKQTEAALLELARHDPLTGAANRRYFFERANEEFARTRRHGSPLSIACFDIDHFKRTNDQYGHAAGDAVLKCLCNTSQDLLRKNEPFARIGGEEFAILMPDTDMKGATHLAERLRQAIAAISVPFNDDEIHVTVSIGVATLSAADKTIEDCLRRADHAMYSAKQHGRNRTETET